MHAITISAVCLLLGQTGPGFDFEPQGPSARKSPFERKGESKAPVLKLGEPALQKGQVERAQDDHSAVVAAAPGNAGEG